MDKVEDISFPVKIGEYLDKVDRALLDVLDQYKGSVFFAPLRYAIKGGKRLRPILLILSYESVGGRGMDPLPAAVAVELAHTESLIHDDVLDRDASRRGAAAFHVLYDREMVLLSADFVLSIILGMTAQYNDARVTRAMALAASRMCEGELEEFKVHRDRETLSVDEYIDIIGKKTASLFAVSAKVGAMIGGAREEEAKALSDYAYLLGTAYQIQDDISDWKRSTMVKKLRIPDANLGKIKYLQEKSKSCVLEAEQRLKKLKKSEAKNLLIDLADLVILRSNNRVSESPES